MTDKLREELEKLSVVYDDARNEFVASTPDGSARDAEVRRYLLAFTDLYEAALADSATAQHRWSDDKIPPGVRYCVLCIENEDIAAPQCHGPPSCTGCGSTSWAWRDRKVGRCSNCPTTDAPLEPTTNSISTGSSLVVEPTEEKSREALLAPAAAQPDNAYPRCGNLHLAEGISPFSGVRHRTPKKYCTACGWPDTLDDRPAIYFELGSLLADGVATDGDHHSRWFLEQIADYFGVPVDERKGIAP